MTTTNGMDLNTEQRNAVRELAAAAIDIVEEVLTPEQLNTIHGQTLRNAVLKYGQLLPFGPQPVDREAVKGGVKIPKRLTPVMQDILTAYERGGPMIDQALVPYVNETLGKTHKPQSIRGARAHLVRMGHVCSTGDADNSAGRSCTVWGLSKSVRKPVEPTRSEGG